jgi:aminoglycoside phosphotransferase (APT) family kinase protein
VPLRSPLGGDPVKASATLPRLDAASARVLPVLGRMRRRWEQRHELDRALKLVPNIVAHIVRPGGVGAGAAGAAGWPVVDARWTDNRVAVIRLESPVASDPIVLKLPATSHGGRSLVSERAVLVALAQISALDEWRTRIPVVVAHGTIGSRMWLAETALAGTPARALLGDPEQRGWLLPEAVAAIAELHRQTAVTRAVQPADLDGWIDEPVARIGRLIADTTGRLPVLELLRHELRAALLDRLLPIGWIHGDFWPGNLLVDIPRRTVTGIVDWDQAAPQQLALHDVLHLVLYSRRIIGGGELGDLVRHVLRRPADLDRWLAELGPAAASELAGGLLGENRRQAVLLYWLHHVGSFAEAGGHADSRFWIRHNIEAVLEAL